MEVDEYGGRSKFPLNNKPPVKDEPTDHRDPGNSEEDMELSRSFGEYLYLTFTLLNYVVEGITSDSFIT